MKFVGLTGGIASGKSTVAKLFAQIGAAVIDADQVSREVCNPGKPAIEEIRREFGNHVIDGRGGLDRVAMREEVFHDKARLKTLESILHPKIYEEIARWGARSLEEGKNLAIIEATLLIESPPPAPLDALIVVTCEKAVRLERAKNRDGLSEEEILRVMENQMTDKQRLPYADFVIQNDRDLDQTRKQVEDVYQKLVGD